MLRGDVEDRLALRNAGDLDDVLARGDNLARIGLCRGHHPIIGRDKFCVAQLVLRDPQIGFGSLHLRLGALEGPERILVSRRVSRIPF